ncbi:hypothetical protein EUTSA_v10011887mg [Eutrema salsugineum]|uniref:Phospholipase/carboxylesterase/thioesterase domain-containing protein n=1 Tax=Eutrema salsugineum TaxID=72664 RepID=V4KSP8_EUTSA|nr:hypothetical protein EUTSA_v10011887mg [Eutrema salsugineum]
MIDDQSFETQRNLKTDFAGSFKSISEAMSRGGSSGELLIFEYPFQASSVLKAVKNVHAVIDKEIAGGINPENVYICGFSQGGALTLASVLLYPKALEGGAVF